METFTTNKKELYELSHNELLNIDGGSWVIVGKIALRVVVGAAGVGTGVAIAIGVGLLAYEVYDALTD